MAQLKTTSWTLIRGAAKGDQQAGDAFALRYAPVIRAYLSARWRNSPLLKEIEDAIQEVFVECFKQGGALGKADPYRPGGFRAFFFGVVRNVALKVEGRRNRKLQVAGESKLEVNGPPASEETPSKVFDRAWARAVMKEAAARQASIAHIVGDDAIRRMEILRLRFQEKMPIREIARLWKINSDLIHREYAKARKEFESTLKEVLTGDFPGAPEEAEKALKDLLSVLS